MSLIIDAVSNGNTGVEKGLHRSAIFIIGTNSDGTAWQGNCLYRSALLLIIAANSDVIDYSSRQ